MVPEHDLESGTLAATVESLAAIVGPVVPDDPLELAIAAMVEASCNAGQARAARQKSGPNRATFASRDTPKARFIELEAQPEAEAEAADEAAAEAQAEAEPADAPADPLAGPAQARLSNGPSDSGDAIAGPDDPACEAGQPALAAAPTPPGRLRGLRLLRRWRGAGPAGAEALMPKPAPEPALPPELAPVGPAAPLLALVPYVAIGTGAECTATSDAALPVNGSEAEIAAAGTPAESPSAPPPRSAGPQPSAEASMATLGWRIAVRSGTDAPTGSAAAAGAPAGADKAGPPATVHGAGDAAGSAAPPPGSGGIRWSTSVAMLPLAVPALLLAAGAIWGGAAAGLALWIALLAALAPEEVILKAGEAGGRAAAAAANADPAAAQATARRGAAIAVALHFPLLALTLFALGGGSGLSAGGWFATFFAAALYFGQISVAAGHQLIHSRQPLPRHAGIGLYASLLCGPQAITHLLVHHPFAGSAEDPATPGPDEGFWSYAPRAYLGGLAAGRDIGRAIAGKRLGKRPAGGRLHPFVLPAALGIVAAAAVAALLGAGTLLAYLLLAATCRLQVMLADYVAHYGLIRAPGAGGAPEPLTAAHSWVSPRLFTGALAPAGNWPSDHLAHPPRDGASRSAGRALTPAPMLPGSAAAMAALALVPPLWRRLMRGRVRALEWQRLEAADRAARQALGAAPE